MEGKMKNKPGFTIKDAFTIMNTGKFYWKLLVIFLVGAFFSSSAYQLSLWVDGVSFDVLFYMVLLGAVSFIGSEFRDGMVGKGSMERYLLWPLNRKRKMLWLYLRSTWIPGLLFWVGGLAFGNFAEGEVVSQLLYPLPYGVSAVFILAFITWRGSFVTADVEGMINVSFRMDSGVGWMNLLLILSPIHLIVTPIPLTYIGALGLAVYGLGLFSSERSNLQLGGMVQNIEERYPKWLGGRFKARGLDKGDRLKKLKSPLFRYYKFLDMEEHGEPIQAYLIVFGTVLFITAIYYGLMGFLFQEQVLGERSMILAFLIGYSTFFIQHVVVKGEGNELSLLLPLEMKKKALGNLLHRFLRPIVFLLINSVIISILIGVFHWVNHQFFTGQDVALLTLTFGTLHNVIRLLPIFILAFTLGDAVLKAYVIVMQQQGYYHIRGSLFIGHFFLYLAPLIFSLFYYDTFIETFPVLTGSSVVLVSLGVFGIGQWGIYHMSKKIQVISL